MIRVITGGTMVPIHSHFALAAPAFGSVGRELPGIYRDAIHPETPHDIEVIYTDMAGGRQKTVGYQAWLMEKAGLKHLNTNDDLSRLLDYIINE